VNSTTSTRTGRVTFNSAADPSYISITQSGVASLVTIKITDLGRTPVFNTCGRKNSGNFGIALDNLPPTTRVALNAVHYVTGQNNNISRRGHDFNWLSKLQLYKNVYSVVNDTSPGTTSGTITVAGDDTREIYDASSMISHGGNGQVAVYGSDLANAYTYFSLEANENLSDGNVCEKNWWMESYFTIDVSYISGPEIIVANNGISTTITPPAYSTIMTAPAEESGGTGEPPFVPSVSIDEENLTWDGDGDTYPCGMSTGIWVTANTPWAATYKNIYSTGVDSDWVSGTASGLGSGYLYFNSVGANNTGIERYATLYIRAEIDPLNTYDQANLSQPVSGTPCP